MKAIPPGVLEATIEILGTEGITQDVIDTQVGALVADPMEARRLIDWIPEAFGLVLIAHLGKPVMPTRFCARNAKGVDLLFPFSCEPIFVAALPLAQKIFHGGPRFIFQNVSFRSATLDAANKMLNAGISLDGAVISCPVLLGIPAEVYPAQPEHFFLRLMPLWKRLLSWYYRRGRDNRRDT